MGNIKVSIDQNRQVTIHEVVGFITADEVISAFEEFASKSPTQYLLWDFSGAEVSSITSDGLRKIVSVGKTKAHLRPGGKTALLVSGDLEFGIARMYEMLAEVHDHPIRHRIFTAKEEAINWLLSGE